MNVEYIISTGGYMDKAVFENRCSGTEEMEICGYPDAESLKNAIIRNEKDHFSVSPLDHSGFRNSFAWKISEDMGLGFNLGNTLDAVAHGKPEFCGVLSEMAWRNPLTTVDMIKAIRQAGFKTLRLPVTWNNHVDEKDKVDPEWMKRVKEITLWCIEEGLYVILNTHHDIREGFLLPDDGHFERAAEFMKNIWTQIAEAFGDITNEKLLFESMNEIRIPGAPFEWTPDYDDEKCIEAMENVNRLNQIFLDTVRSSGGQNRERILVIPGYSTSTEGVCWEGFKLPKDAEEGRLIVAAHIYSPAHFAFYLKEGANITCFDIDDPASTLPIDERLGKLYRSFVSRGVPVNIDEFGTVDKDNDRDRVNCLAYTLAKASELSIRTCYWDNGIFKAYGNGMAIFDRRRLCFPDMSPVKAMLQGISMYEGC